MIITFPKSLRYLILLIIFGLSLSCNNDDSPEAMNLDIDNDSIENSLDNCPNTSNPSQDDFDGDGIGDICDPDDDNDGIEDSIDNCPLTPNANQEDQDNDGIGDVCDDEISDVPFPCNNGLANGFPCHRFDLLSQLPINLLGGAGAEGNDSWGWTDPMDGKEYALVGTTSGTAFVDITDAANPIFLGTLPTTTVSNIWRDIKTYNNHAYIVSEALGHGMQVFDLTRLRNVNNPPQTFTADANYFGFDNAHNIVINEDSGFAYVVGSDTFDGGPHFINIQNPTMPVAAGGYADDSYSHDAQVVTYNGPDMDYLGKEIYIGSNEDEVVILDVTDKNNVVRISSISYNNLGYAHQGWFTEDMTYFLLGDEVDEIDFGVNTRTVVFDFTDLDNPQFHMNYFGPTLAIDHNGYVVGNTFYIANYSAGVRAVDISNIANGEMMEIGFFDTFIPNDDTVFNGAWNIYPFFESGNILVSDIDGGMYIVRPN